MRISILGLLLMLTNVRSLTGKIEGVHAFYYLWYGDRSHDGQYKHWNHEVLPHWEDRVNKMYSNIGNAYSPPENLHSPYYPLNGPYSTRNKTQLLVHLKDMESFGIQVAVVSWWGQASKSYTTDTQGVSTDLILNELLQVVEESGIPISIAFHLEPYPSRSAASVREDVGYIYDSYGNFKCLLRVDNKLVFYVYDSYYIKTFEWRQVLKEDGPLTVRNTRLDSVFIGLWLNHEHGRDLAEGGFDGFYTYFSSINFSYGSNIDNWRYMCRYAKSKNMLCILSVGPGYNDEKIRPWNSHNTKDRKSGQYYIAMWKAAIAAGVKTVAITSYNEWGEGTQIEPAASRGDVVSIATRIRAEIGDVVNSVPTETYLDYEEPYFYLKLTAKYSKLLSGKSSSESIDEL